MQGILKRIEKAENMRDDVVDGEFWSWPQVGKEFRFFKLNGEHMRLIETSHVIKIHSKFPEEIEFEVKDGRFKVIKTGE